MTAEHQSFDQVHVLKHVFRPNQPFEADLMRLTKAGQSGPRSFSVYGSDERIIDTYDVGGHDFNGQKYDADKFLKDLGTVTIHPEIDDIARSGFTRMVMKNKETPAALQLVMIPTPLARYNEALNAFNKIKVGERGYALGFQASRLYVNIPFEQLRPMGEVRENLQVIRERLADSADHLYQLTLEPRLTGEFVFRPFIPRPYGGTYYPDSRVS